MVTNNSNFKNLELKLDCRYFIGEKPCKFKTLCKSCQYYSPMGFRILIIKLGAMGDVLRTTPLLPALKKKYSESHITWVTDKVSLELLQMNPYIDRLLSFSYDSVLRLEEEKFDLMICLDKETRATALAMRVNAEKKQGFGLSQYGSIFPLNRESNYAFRLGIDDNLKFKENKRSYQEIVFEATGLKYNKDEYILSASSASSEDARNLFNKIGIKGYVKLIKRISNHANPDTKILLLGGSGEVKINKVIKEKLKSRIYDSGCENTLSQFIAIVDRCDIVISSDTLTMHIGIGLKKRVLAIFGPTCHQEIELYGRGDKVISSIDCAPCYKGRCDLKDNCMTTISVDEVYEKAMILLSRI